MATPLSLPDSLPDSFPSTTDNLSSHHTLLRDTSTRGALTQSFTLSIPSSEEQRYHSLHYYFLPYFPSSTAMSDTEVKQRPKRVPAEDKPDDPTAINHQSFNAIATIFLMHWRRIEHIGSNEVDLLGWYGGWITPWTYFSQKSSESEEMDN